MYDEEGHLKSQSSFGGTTTTINYSNDRTIRTVKYSDGSENRFVYDSIGNITEAQNAYGKTLYQYDQGGRLIYQKDVTTGEEIHFYYDDAGNRTKLLSSNRETLYSYGQNHEVKEIFDNKERLSVKLEYNKNGSEVLRKFGNGTTEQTLYNPFGYLGKQQDATSKLFNYGYRDYKPQNARFTTVGPIRDGTNWFAYVNNDPVNFIDLWGLCTGSDNNSVLCDITELLLFPNGINIGLMPEHNSTIQVQTPNKIILNYIKEKVTNNNLENIIKRGKDIVVGLTETAIGFSTWVATISGASMFTVETEGIGTAVAGAALVEGLAFGAFLVGSGLSRIVGAHDDSLNR